MQTYPPFAARPLDPSGRADALTLAERARAHGVYLGHARAAGEGEAVLCWGGEALLGVLWFGPRGNLVLVEEVPLDPQRVADAVQRSRWPWRIALGRAATIDALAGRLARPPLVLRDQVYHACRPADARPAPEAPGVVRLAVKADVAQLMEATLELNRTDLNVEPKHVDRRWLRQTVEARVREGTTLVIGEPGRPSCKLDIGSQGPFGCVIEGVFTFPAQRRRGLARHLVAEAASRCESMTACLHVDAANEGARRAYELAGLKELQQCRIVLAR